MHETLVHYLSGTFGMNLSEACRDAGLSLQQYMQLTRYTLDTIVWYKRFTESMIEGE